ncbi:MAG: ribosome-binding factor A [Elusimicrobia bacterium RIFCSPLOWO2_01_FULL_54_10]|nr:MAG: ribosome-binding factor A [Elusimicrobia bacterium RIFCSPLOWO2_01_FULL_54_10]
MFKRSERVSELLRHEISQYIQEVTEPKLGFVTITGVQVTDDLMDAKIFFSVFGTDEEKAVSEGILKGMAPKMRGFLGRKLESLYKAPNLHFVYDHTPERAQRVSDIITKISKERPPDSGPEKP